MDIGLAAKTSVYSLSTSISWLQEGLYPRSVEVVDTVDDGYRDSLGTGPMAASYHPRPQLPGKATPFRLLFGRDCRTQIDATSPSPDNEGMVGLHNLVADQSESLRLIRALRKDLQNRHEQRHRRRERENARIRRTSTGTRTKPGDLVLVKESGSALYNDCVHPKLTHDRWTGPWTVTAVIQAVTVHGPVHRSWVSLGWTQSLYNADPDSFTKTKSPGFVRVPVEVRLILAFSRSRRRCLCSWRFCRSLRNARISRRLSLWSATRLCSPTMPSLSGLGEVASIWVRQSRPNNRRKGVALPGSCGSGVVRCSHRAGCTYSYSLPSPLEGDAVAQSWCYYCGDGPWPCPSVVGQFGVDAVVV